LQLRKSSFAGFSFMSRIALVVAVSRNGVIGRAGRLPWHISSDLKLFKAITLGKPIIMGRKTWESLPRKPLPGRLNIIITRQSSFRAEGAEVASDAQSALAIAGNPEEIAVIGGGEIYQMFLPMANRIYYTEVNADVDGDTYFTKPDVKHWSESKTEPYPQGLHDSAGFTLRVFDRL
jgi:dihydrofolate reductase